MRKLIVLILPVLALFSATSTLGQNPIAPGIWSNAEDEYFAEEEGRAKPEWTGLEIASNGKWRRIDPYGAAQSEWATSPIPNLSQGEGEGWQLNGSELRRAIPFSCWVAVRKYTSKPDGTDDWTFERNLKSFDQGGRVFVSGNGVAPDVTIRLRNVTWAKGSPNKPVRVLYVHTDDQVRADSYSWGAPTSEIVGINLRWVQASCSETPTNIEGV